MGYSGPIMYSYFDKCLLNDALEEWQSIMPHEGDQTVENLEFSLEEWVTNILPDNAFLYSNRMHDKHNE